MTEQTIKTNKERLASFNSMDQPITLLNSSASIIESFGTASLPKKARTVSSECLTTAFATATTTTTTTATAAPVHKKKDIQVLLCGCGNAVHVLTSFMGQHLLDQNHPSCQEHEYEYTVNVFSLGHGKDLARDTEPTGGYIRCTNDVGIDTFGKANIISDNAADVVPGCQVILFALPTDRHEVYLNAMKPYIQEGTIIGSMPGEGGFDLCVRNVLGPALAGKCTLFSLDTLPWACRIQTFGQVVQVLCTKQDIELCVSPGDQCWKVRDLLQPMVGPCPKIRASPTSNFLGCTLMNPNAMAHPAILYGLLRHWDGVTPFEKPPLFYQALDEYTANVMDGVSQEILAIKAAILKEYPSVDLKSVRSIGDFFEEAYRDDILDHSSLCKMFNSNKGYDGLTMPTKKVKGGYVPLFDHRYLSEDLPCGMLVQKGIAELAGVATPVMDKVIAWCQAKNNTEYMINGKLEGKDFVTTKAPQRYGYTDLKSFMEDNGYV